MPTTDPTTPSSARFAPHAAREMAGMFVDVSGRYDMLNRIMTLGQDSAWRLAMWRCVPESARVCLDLCTGSGVSTSGLRRPGRTVLGMDVSLGMLQVADSEFGGDGWAPRFACADAFQLPLPDASIDTVTIAFGIRNLRPRARAIAELRRVLRSGGSLVVLEAAAPAPGPLAPFTRAWIRYAIPLAGRVSPDPSAYEYLSRSIFEFGAGPEFETDLISGEFEITHRRSFMFGATRLWVARAPGPVGQIASVRPIALQGARSASPEIGARQSADHAPDLEWRAWSLANLAVSLGLTLAFAWGGWSFAKWAPLLPLQPWQRWGGGLLIVLGLVTFIARTLSLGLRALGPGPRR